MNWIVLYVELSVLVSHLPAPWLRRKAMEDLRVPSYVISHGAITFSELLVCQA